ncbi:DUF6255 family natural product biosynthesis protein [Streptomyces sp. STD57]|uniref:DUF6255 family natural product biosynthesis protein n=1 Tax=Streptomyces sp. STD57 TaxID=3231528 RepID=UPI00345B6E1D
MATPARPRRTLTPEEPRPAAGYGGTGGRRVRGVEMGDRTVEVVDSLTGGREGLPSNVRRAGGRATEGRSLVRACGRLDAGGDAARCDRCGTRRFMGCAALLFPELPQWAACLPLSGSTSMVP